MKAFSYRSTRYFLLVGAIALGAAAGNSACGSSTANGTFPTNDAGVDGPSGVQYRDFPTEPIVDSPSVDPHAFSGTTVSSSGGPCLLEPGIGAMMPRNWVRPRFRWATSDENVFELRVRVSNQANDLVVLTTKDRWTMPKAMWEALRTHSDGQEMTVSVLGGTLAAGAARAINVAQGSKGPVSIAPVDAPGTIVYWTTGTSTTPGSGTGTALKGFRVGDEAVADVVRPSDVPVNCVGCHNSTPDGSFVGISVADSPSTGNVARIAMRSVSGAATEPSFLTSTARSLLQRSSQELPTFSKAHYAPGDRIALTLMPMGGRSELVWTDLEATSPDQGRGWGVFARTGDAKGAGSAAISHDGNTIVYSSATNVGAGTIFSDGDLYTIPYGDRLGGTATPVSGASTSQYNEYYASFSPDDRLIAFTRAPPESSSYDTAQSEIFVVPSAGGNATRLLANDPPSCSQVTSPGVKNSWSKWSPEVLSFGGRSYYFLVFSSRRDQASPGPQLYVTTVVVEPSGAMTSFAALYLWNQPSNENNHTPAWDTFAIPPVPPPK